eukprot:7119256-Alexandrium_andersonii.AAC.1
MTHASPQAIATPSTASTLSGPTPPPTETAASDQECEDLVDDDALMANAVANCLELEEEAAKDSARACASKSFYVEWG